MGKKTQNTKQSSNDNSQLEERKLQESEVTFAPTAAFDSPIDVERNPVDIPTQVEAIMSPVRVQATDEDVGKVISKSAIASLFFTNGPILDPQRYISDVTKKLVKMAEDYQRKYQLPFFAQVRDLIIIKDGETAPTDAELMRDYRKYCKRAAHEYYYYDLDSKRYAMSLMNIAQMSSLNGEGTYGRLANMTKWSYINGHTKRFASFYFPNGCINYLLKGTVLATGAATNGTPLFAISWWRNSGFGNAGEYGMPFDQIAYFDQRNKKFKLQGKTPVRARKLVSRIGQEIVQKALDTTDFMSGNGYVKMKLQQEYTRGSRIPTAIPTDPKFENPNVKTFQFNTATAGDIPSMSYTANKSGAEGYVSLTNFNPGNGIDYDNLGSRAWDSYKFYETWMLTYHPLFAEPNSDWVKLGLQLGLLESTQPSVDKIVNFLRTRITVDIADIVRMQEYKGGNKATTATIREPISILDGGNVENVGTQAKPEYVITSVARAGTQFDDNFERYLTTDADQVTTQAVLARAIEWPKLTPTIFSNYGEQDLPSSVNPEEAEPLVLNATTEYSQLYDGEEDIDFGRSITGKLSALFDYSCCSDIDQANQEVGSVAMSSNFMKNYLQQNNGLVYQDDPTNVWVLCKPYIDNTDVYQCGFYVILDATDKANNEWTKYLYKDEDYTCIKHNSLSEIGKVLPLVDTGSTADYAQTDVMQVDRTETGWFLNNWLNPAYRMTIGTGLVFVGQGIFLTPELVMMHKDSGYLYGNMMIAGADYTALVDQFDKAKAIIDGPVSGTPSWGPFDGGAVITKANGDDLSAMLLALTVLMMGDTYNGERSRLVPTSARDILARICNNELDHSDAMRLDTLSFHPSFGEVMVNRFPTPDIGFVHYDPQLERTDVIYAQELFKTKFQRGFHVIVPEENNEAWDAYNAANMRGIFMQSKAADFASTMLWFIDHFTITRPSIDVALGSIQIPNKHITFRTTSAEKAFFRLINYTQLKFAGMDDSVSFWSDVVQERSHPEPLPSWRAGATFPELKVIYQLPKERESKALTKGKFYRHAQTIKTTNSLASWLGGTYGSKEAAGPSKGSGKGKDWKARKGKRSDRTDGGKTPTESAFSGTADSTTKEQDAEIAKGMEKANGPERAVVNPSASD